jgi:hypothetical protein
VFPLHVLLTVEFIVNPGLIPNDNAIEVLHCNNIPSNKNRCPYESDYALLSVAAQTLWNPKLSYTIVYAPLANLNFVQFL